MGHPKSKWNVQSTVAGKTRTVLAASVEHLAIKIRTNMWHRPYCTYYGDRNIVQ